MAALAGERLMAVRRIALFAALWWGICWPAFVPVAAAEPTSSPLPTAADFASEVPRLRRLCAPLWGDLSAECMAELDRAYLDRDVDDNFVFGSLWRRVWPLHWQGPRPLRDRLVWRHVFEDPLALRIAVDEAAADPQCQAKRGEAPHRLREDCAADAFARLSVLHRDCGRALERDEYMDDWAAWWERSRQGLAEDPEGPYQNTESRRNRALDAQAFDESELQFAWRLRKCRAVPPAAMGRIVGVQLTPLHFRARRQSFELLAAAARLGSTWANTRYGDRDAAEVNATAESDLVLAYLRRAKGTSRGGRCWRLAYLLAAREYDSRTGDLRFDWSGLERHVSQAAIDCARPVVERILREGWQPMEEHDDLADLTWPWAVAPPVLETRFIRRRLDENGRMRWVYESGYQVWISRGRESNSAAADGTEMIVSHTRISKRRLPRLGQWVDEHGRPRWLDYDGVEHWIDAGGAEHWVDFGGTEWILLPPDPLPDGRRR